MMQKNGKSVGARVSFYDFEGSFFLGGWVPIGCNTQSQLFKALDFFLVCPSPHVITLHTGPFMYWISVDEEMSLRKSENFFRGL